MIPMISMKLTMALVAKRLSMSEVSVLAGVGIDDVFDAENFLGDAEPFAVQLIAVALDVTYRSISDGGRGNYQSTQGSPRMERIPCAYPINACKS